MKTQVFYSLALLCLGLLGACSRDSRVGYETAKPAPTTGTTLTQETALSGDSTTYPYDLWIGRAVTRVEQEPNASRLKIELVRWSQNPYGGSDAIFCATNPGNHPVLVWNVRQQVSFAHRDGAAKPWETRENDYPGRGWSHSTIPAGGSVQFPMLSPAKTSKTEWRVCLLYSRELAGSHPPSSRFGGDFESISPSVREPDEQ